MSLSPAERDALIRRYAEGPAKVRAAWEKVPEAARAWRPAAGKWSAHEIVCHCGDAEATAAMRIRYLAAETEPLIIGYDQDTWAKTLDYAGHPVEPALALMDAARASTVARLRRTGIAVVEARGGTPSRASTRPRTGCASTPSTSRSTRRRSNGRGRRGRLPRVASSSTGRHDARRGGA